MEPCLPIIMDIEASGFGAGSYPIEVGVISPLQESSCFLIKPEQDWLHWSESAEQKHHIKRATLFEFGVDAADVVEELNQLLAGQTVYSDAWGQDYSWLHKLYQSVNRQPTYKLEALYQILTQAQIKHWHQAKSYLQKKLHQPRHRASQDAALIQSCYEFTLNNPDFFD